MAFNSLTFWLIFPLIFGIYWLIPAKSNSWRCELPLYHLEYQRTLISEVIKTLVNGHIDSRKIRSVNFLIVTHSPFVLSDIPSSRILFLEKGKPSLKLEHQTFSANIHELLYHHFFIEKPMGEVSFFAQNEIISFYNNWKKGIPEAAIKSFIEKVPLYRFAVSLIGEPYLGRVLCEMLDDIEIELKSKDEKSLLLDEKWRLEKRVKEINARLKNEKN